MKILLIPGALEAIQNENGMTDQEFAEYIGISRSQLWRILLPKDDKRFSLGQDVIAKLLQRFPNRKFEELFFLDLLSHECDEIQQEYKLESPHVSQLNTG
ncbi:hypothetical protein ACX1C1_21690 [Paenibacillus sp. strain BS8-2]